MEMSKEKLIANILKLVDQKQYKEAYEFLMSNDCSDSKSDDTLKCFKLIAALIRYLLLVVIPQGSLIKQ